jgi:hypothetical protein
MLESTPSYDTFIPILGLLDLQGLKDLHGSSPIIVLPFILDACGPSKIHLPSKDFGGPTPKSFYLFLYDIRDYNATRREVKHNIIKTHNNVMWD